MMLSPDFMLYFPSTPTTETEDTSHYESLSRPGRGHHCVSRPVILFVCVVVAGLTLSAIVVSVIFGVGSDDSGGEGEVTSQTEQTESAWKLVYLTNLSSWLVY